MLRNEGIGFHRRSVLIQCFNNKTARDIFNVLAQEFNRSGIPEQEQIVHLRSGEGVRNKEGKLAVEVSRINIANVWDAKGYDADTVYLINPDGCKGTPYEKRIQFYVAATRAKQFLAVYSSLPERQSPIIYDAIRSMNQLKSTVCS
jgi:superfamily I DNA and RNA helicase